jgi:hypothetical protein
MTRAACDHLTLGRQSTHIASHRSYIKLEFIKSFCSSFKALAIQGTAVYDNDFIIKLLLLQGEDGMGGAGLGGSGFEFGVDPNEDPELALVSTIIHSCMFR